MSPAEVLALLDAQLTAYMSTVSLAEKKAMVSALLDAQLTAYMTTVSPAEKAKFIENLVGEMEVAKLLGHSIS